MSPQSPQRGRCPGTSPTPREQPKGPFLSELTEGAAPALQGPQPGGSSTHHSRPLHTRTWPQPEAPTSISTRPRVGALKALRFGQGRGHSRDVQGLLDRKPPLSA